MIRDRNPPKVGIFTFLIFTPIYGPIWDFYFQDFYVWDCFVREKFVTTKLNNHKKSPRAKISRQFSQDEIIFFQYLLFSKKNITTLFITKVTYYI